MSAGISRKSQELTAIFLGIRLYCRFANVHALCSIVDVQMPSSLMISDHVVSIVARRQHFRFCTLSYDTSCSFVMEYDVHTLLDLLTFVATGWVLFMMHTKLKKSYSSDMDTVRLEYIVRSR
jgi:hypothetical protein